MDGQRTDRQPNERPENIIAFVARSSRSFKVIAVGASRKPVCEFIILTYILVRMIGVFYFREPVLYSVALKY